MSDLARAIDAVSPHMEMKRFKYWLDTERSQGSWFRTCDGEELLDCCGAFGSLPLGWNHPDLTEPAFVRELGRVAVNKPALCAMLTSHVADFTEAFYRVGGMGQTLPWLFLIDGGALAVENALKAAFDWKVQMNLAEGRGELGSRIIHFERCFHGRSGYTMSMTDSPDPKKTQWYPQFDWPRIPPPLLRFPIDDAALAEVARAEAECLDRVQAAFEAHPHDVAGIIIEPIQAEGGDRHFRPEFLAGLRRLCDEHDALLIFDEVQTGVATSGTFWCWEQLGTQPDLLAFGKKAHISGVLAGGRLDEVPDHVFAVPGRVNSTFGGNLVDMVRATRILEVIERDDLMDHVRGTGSFFLQRLNELSEELDGFAHGARGRGFLLAIDVDSTELRNRAIAACREQGLFVFGCGERSIRFRPALTFTRELVDEAVRRLGAALRAVRA